MHATVRRYEGVDESRTDELTKKLDESLLPRLSKLPGFEGYYLIEAGNGVMSSIDLFETSAQADESTRVAATWVRDEKLETALPNPPKITDGEGHRPQERFRPGIRPRLDAERARKPRALCGASGI
jgi:hypothetical protein